VTLPITPFEQVHRVSFDHESNLVKSPLMRWSAA
jgi:hypothetical protein